MQACELEKTNLQYYHVIVHALFMIIARNVIQLSRLAQHKELAAHLHPAINAS